MAPVSKFNHDVNALFRGQTSFKARVGLVSFRIAREYLNDLVHNLIVSTWESGGTSSYLGGGKSKRISGASVLSTIRVYEEINPLSRDPSERPPSVIVSLLLSNQ